MRRSEFIDDITTFCELRDFCNDEGLSDCDDYFDADDLDDEVYNDMNDSDYGWRSLRDHLYAIDTDCDFYRRDGCLDYTPMYEDDLCELKDSVLDYMDNYREWDPEEDDDEDEDDEDWDPDDEYVYQDPVVEDPNKDVKIGEFFELPVM